MAIEKLSVILELVTGNYNREAKQAADATGRIGNSAKSVTGQLGAMIGPAAIGGAILGLGRMALAAGENADRLFDLQAQTGLSTDALQEWEFVAKAAGANTETFSDAVKQVVKSLSEAAAGTGNAAKAYETLGVSVLDASGNMRSAGEITDEVFEKLAGMENITARNALAQDIFGKKWEETISVLDLGSEALGNLREEGKKGVVSAEALRNSDKFRETWQKFLATVGPKLNEALGKIAPALTTVADAAIDAFDAMEPLIDVLGFVADKFSDANVAIDEGRDAPSKWAQSWAIAGDIGQGAIFGVVGMLGALFDEENRLKDNTAEATGEISDSWARMGATFRPIIGETIRLLDSQAGSHRNVATAATTQRTALINLFTAQADLLDPIRSVILLRKESIEAEKRLVEVQDDSKASSEDLSIAVIEAEQAHLRLNSAASALTADQIQAFANTAKTELDLTDQEVLDLLDSLHLLDGTNVDIAFTFSAVNESLLKAINTTSGGEISIKDIQVRQHGGRVRRGEPYLVGEQGSELMIPDQNGMILPHGQLSGGFGSSQTFVTKYGPTISIARPMDNFHQDLQHATILASLTNLVEGF